MVAAVRGIYRGRKLSPQRTPEVWPTGLRDVGNSRSPDFIFFICSHVMPFAKRPDKSSDQISGQAQDQDHAQAQNATSLPGQGDDFGLTPKPKVRAQRIDPLLGVDLGGVKIVKLIGEGGMGRVYEAQQARPSRTVAVKVIRQGITSEKTMRRFEREAEFLAKLQHHGIAQIFIVGTYSSDFGDVPFYVMEFLANAKPITNYVHEQGLSLEEKIQLFKHVCEAVAHGHDRGIVHRDLKPGNILVDGQGSPKVIDFGVARSTDSDLTLESMKTDTGQLIGTVQYMSPEQFGPDPDDLDGRADVYSLGVVLYEILAGALPYSVRKKALHEASRVVCEEIPLPLRSLDKAIPRDISAIAERCLQKNRRDRYYTAGELAADLGRYLDGKPVKAKPSSLIGRVLFPRPLRKLVTRRTGLVLISGSLLVLGSNQLIGSRLLDFEHYSPQRATLKASAVWTPTKLQVRKGHVYRLVATGSCTDTSGVSFGPEGTAPAELRTVFGPPAEISHETAKEAFVEGLPRHILLARVRESRISLPVGLNNTFVAPWTGEMSFRVNNETETDSPKEITGNFSLALERVFRPQLVDKDGKTRIETRVGRTKYLLFRPDGLQWEYESSLGWTEELANESPTLINGIAWWPLPDQMDTEGWKDLTLTKRTHALRTEAFVSFASHGVAVHAVAPPVEKGIACVASERRDSVSIPSLTLTCPSASCGVVRVLVSPTNGKK